MQRATCAASSPGSGCRAPGAASTARSACSTAPGTRAPAWRCWRTTRYAMATSSASAGSAPTGRCSGAASIARRVSDRPGPRWKRSALTLLGDLAQLAEQLAGLVAVGGAVLERLADQLEAGARQGLGVLLELALGGHDLDAQARQQVVERGRGLGGGGGDLERAADLDAAGLERQLLLGALELGLEVVALDLHHREVVLEVLHPARGFLVELVAAIDSQLGLQLLDAAAQHADLDVGLAGAGADRRRGRRGLLRRRLRLGLERRDVAGLGDRDDRAHAGVGRDHRRGLEA